MGLFSKKPTAQDMLMAKEYIARIKKEIDEVVGNFTATNCQEAVEFTMLTTCAFLGSGTLTKNVNACIAEAIVESFEKFKPKKSKQETIGLVSIVLNQIYETYKNAEKRKLNPLYEVYDGFYQNKMLQNRTYTDNAFFIVDAKKVLNRIIEKMSIAHLFQYKFSAEELRYPEPTFFMNHSKAPQTVLTKKDNTPVYFSVVDKIDYNHSTYKILLNEREGNTMDIPLIIKECYKVSEGSKIEFVSGDEYDKVYDIFIDHYTVFSAYNCPLY